MVELLVDCRLPSTPRITRDGAVIVAGLPGTRWGTDDVKGMLVLLYDDPAIEAQLRDMLRAGDLNPAISYPYAEYDEHGDMTKLSSLAIDETKLNVPGLKDTTLPLPPILPTPDAWLRRKEPGILARLWNWTLRMVGLGS